MCSRAERKRRRRAALGTILINGKPCRGTIEIRVDGEAFDVFAAVNYVGRGQGMARAARDAFFNRDAQAHHDDRWTDVVFHDEGRAPLDIGLVDIAIDPEDIAFRWPSDGETDALRGPRVTELYRTAADGARSGEGVPLRVRRLFEGER